MLHIAELGISVSLCHCVTVSLCHCVGSSDYDFKGVKES